MVLFGGDRSTHDSNFVMFVTVDTDCLAHTVIRHVPTVRRINHGCLSNWRNS